MRPHSFFLFLVHITKATYPFFIHSPSSQFLASVLRTTAIFLMFQKVESTLKMLPNFIWQIFIEQQICGRHCIGRAWIMHSPILKELSS